MPAGRRLLDTGPLVALLSQDDDAHEGCRDALESFQGILITTEAVLTEALHLLGRRAQDAARCLDFFLRGGAVLIPMNIARLRRSRDLMLSYGDVPMDFADATLVALAEEMNLPEVFTLDRRGFTAYRWRRSRSFLIFP